MFRLCTNIIRNASEFGSSSISSVTRSTLSLVSLERSRSYATAIKRSKASATKPSLFLKPSKSKSKRGLVKVKISNKAAKSKKPMTKQAALTKVVKIADTEDQPEEGHAVKNLPLVNDHLAVPHITEADRQHDLVQILRKFTDLTEPHLWFPVAREMKRKIIIHAGPTNSGKTYHALQQLMEAETGTYCAPLRLLAHEVYDKLTAKGITTNLITGQTVTKHDKARHIACTMEMLDINRPIDVCVLDEYQMIGDATRGWAWTRALLGVPAKEIHLTGDESAIGLIRALAGHMNEEVEVRNYERLSPLTPASSPFSNYSSVRPGDAFIAFSRKELYSIKAAIERTNSSAKCCMVYGDLPPETRAEQARLFNDPNSGYNVLVGTDAIGMGLNLNIRRIIFSKVEKFDGETRRQLKVSEVKQIAGRAGRYGSIYDSGTVTAMDKPALKYIRAKLQTETTPINRAGIFPLFDQIVMFDQFSQNKLKFSEVLEYFMKVANISNKYFLCKTRDMVGVARALDNMTMAIKDRYVFCMAPVDTKNPTVLYYLIVFAKKFTRGIVPWTLKSKKLPDMAIEELETMFKVSELYIWLSYRFDAEFTGRAKASEYKTKCKELIGKKLMQMKTKKTLVNNKFRN